MVSLQKDGSRLQSLVFPDDLTVKLIFKKTPGLGSGSLSVCLKVIISYRMINTFLTPDLAISV